MSSHATIWKDDRLVATANLPLITKLDPNPAGIKEMELYYFHHITLPHVVIFEHLTGKSLIHFLDNSNLIVVETEPDVHTSPVGPLRYVHGRSEILKGKQIISLVLLAKPTFDKEVSEMQWRIYLPEIYKRFLALKKYP